MSASAKRRGLSPEGQAKMIASRRAKPPYRHSPETREKIRQWHTGHVWGPEFREAVSRGTRQRSPESRLHTPETRERIRVALSGKVRPPFSAEWRARMGAAQKGRHHSAETKEKMRQAALRHPPPRVPRPTSIEIALRDEFDRRGLAYGMNKGWGRWRPDFTFEAARVFVQADGEYWHRLPDRQRCDREFDQAAQAAGWKVLRFWEIQICENVAACVAVVEAVLEQRLGDAGEIL